MKRSWTIMTAGILLALAAYFGFYYAGSAKSRRLEHNPKPELAWLKEQFQLNDGEYTRICQMHEGYLQGCAERCRLIDDKNAHLKRLLAASDRITLEIEKTLSETAQLRAECQKEMLRHFYEVSRTMPPEQGKRYLAWVQEQTVLSDTHSQMSPMHHPAEPIPQMQHRPTHMEGHQ